MIEDIKVLKNPKTQLYLNVKRMILSEHFSWFWQKTTIVEDEKIDEKKYHNISCYSHTFLTRPEDNKKYSSPSSNYLDEVSEVFKEILDHNNIRINTFIRMNANCTHQYSKVLNCIPHTDHEFPHNNIIMYLSDSGGSTIVNSHEYSPSEDDVIVFGGERHYYQTPRHGRRVVLVATFL